MFEMNISIVIIILIIIVVSIIVGYGIIKVIDDKLSSVVVNVPQQDYKLPTIYLSIDKDSNIKKIKLNDVISTLNSENENENESESELETDMNNLSFDNSTNDTSIYDFDDEMGYEYDTQDQSPIENFGSFEPGHHVYSRDKQSLLGGQISKNADLDINKNEKIIKDPNYNLLTDIPLLVSPDIVSPNMKFKESYPYYSNRAKLVDKKDSQLVKLQNMYLDRIKKVTKNSKIKKVQNMVSEKFINGPFDGYNSHVNLKENSYGNVTSVGKSLLTPYVSYPIPS